MYNQNENRKSLVNLKANFLLLLMLISIIPWKVVFLIEIADMSRSPVWLEL